MVKLMDNTVIHEVYSSVKQAFFTVIAWDVSAVSQYLTSLGPTSDLTPKQLTL